MSIQLTHRLNELAMSYEAKGQDADLHIAETLHRAIALINSLEREVARPSFQPIDYEQADKGQAPFVFDSSNDEQYLLLEVNCSGGKAYTHGYWYSDHEGWDTDMGPMPPECITGWMVSPFYPKPVSKSEER